MVAALGQAIPAEVSTLQLCSVLQWQTTRQHFDDLSSAAHDNEVHVASRKPSTTLADCFSDLQWETEPLQHNRTVMAESGIQVRWGNRREHCWTHVPSGNADEPGSRQRTRTMVLPKVVFKRGRREVQPAAMLPLTWFGHEITRPSSIPERCPSWTSQNPRACGLLELTQTSCQWGRHAPAVTAFGQNLIWPIPHLAKVNWPHLAILIWPNLANSC